MRYGAVPSNDFLCVHDGKVDNGVYSGDCRCAWGGKCSLLGYESGLCGHTHKSGEQVTNAGGRKDTRCRSRSHGELTPTTSHHSSPAYPSTTQTSHPLGLTVSTKSYTHSEETPRSRMITHNPPRSEYSTGVDTAPFHHFYNTYTSLLLPIDERVLYRSCTAVGREEGWLNV